MENRLKVMLTTEGTFPFHQGGVSTWCDSLVHKLKDIDFVLYSIIMNPFVTQKFNLPTDSSLIKVPLWGTEEPSEHLSTPFSEVYIAKRRTVDEVIDGRFIPLFEEMINEILTKEKNATRLAYILFELHKYFQEFEYKKSFKSKITWDAYKAIILKFTADKKNKMEQPNVYSLIQSLGWIYRFLNILNTPIPDVHVTHSAAAAFCGIPCVLAKLKYNTPFMLTEHGVYLREQYLTLSQRGYSSFLNTFLMGFIHSVTGLNYAFADQVSPVCQYNTRWERQFGVDQRKIKVIYNGVDEKVFHPEIEHKRNVYPTVVTVARIDPNKDIITLLRSAYIVKMNIPDVRFIVYGSVAVPDYFDECLKLREELGLTEAFIFAGHTADAPAAYKSGDITVLSSISEAFPYSVVEAMMCGKPVISTDVGGVREAIGETGIVVKPREPEEFAKAIIMLLKNPSLCASMGAEARDRALNNFTLNRVLGLHFKSYLNLAVNTTEVKAIPESSSNLKLLIEKGFALMDTGMYEDAIKMLRSVLKLAYDSPAAPVILTEIANAYNSLGQFNLALQELEKAENIEKIINSKNIA